MAEHCCCLNGNGDQVLEAIGLFKAESRSLFADLLPREDDLSLDRTF